MGVVRVCVRGFVCVCVCVVVVVGGGGFICLFAFSGRKRPTKTLIPWDKPYILQLIIDTTLH